MSLKHGLLGLLNYGSMTGYELNKVFKDSLSFFWQAQTSQIYRELATMEKNNGWLTSKRVIQDDKPNKRIYTITAAGKEEFNNWLSAPEEDISEAMTIRSAFLMRVFFAGETSNEHALSMFRMFREKCTESASASSTVPEIIVNYEAEVDSAECSKYWELAALFGEIYHRAGLEWIEKAIETLEGKT